MQYELRPVVHCCYRGYTSQFPQRARAVGPSYALFSVNCLVVFIQLSIKAIISVRLVLCLNTICYPLTFYMSSCKSWIIYSLRTDSFYGFM